jgi:DNA polymerase-3 subunit epsilon
MSDIVEEKTNPSFWRPDFHELGAEAPASPPIIAFVDVETTGLDPGQHEIIELGIVRADARTLDVVDEYSALVRPERLETATPEALAVSGFTEAGWTHAVSLRKGLLEASPLLRGAILAGHNVGFDWSFLEAGLRREGLPIPTIDRHRVDTASLGWPLLATGEIESLSLDALASSFGLERRAPHRALEDARVTLGVARRLLERMVLGGRAARLTGDEREIFQVLAERLDKGRQSYGPWHVGDGRDYSAEAFAEVIDALHYAAAALVRRRRDSRRMPRVYVCHPFADDIPVNTARVRALCHCLVERGVLPIAPHLYLPEFVDEETERERALALCLELVGTCDELCVFGERITDGMAREIRHAKARGIPVRFEKEVFA